MKSWWDEEATFIHPFDLHHIVYISILLITLVLLLTNRTYVKENAQKIAKVILTISIMQQILLYSWYVFETGFHVSESLPLHISRISSLLGIYFLITKNMKVLDVLFYFGLFAYGSFLYPQRIYPIYHVIGISYVINHTITILLPIFGYIAYRWRPTFKSAFRAYVLFVVYFFFVYFLNPLIDGNYFYLKYRPFFNHWPDYLHIPGVLIVTFVGFLIAYYFVKFLHKVTKDVQNQRNESA